MFSPLTQDSSFLYNINLRFNPFLRPGGEKFEAEGAEGPEEIVS